MRYESRKRPRSARYSTNRSNSTNGSAQASETTPGSQYRPLRMCRMPTATAAESPTTEATRAMTTPMGMLDVGVMPAPLGQECAQMQPANQGSGWPDSDRRPPGPKPGALPG